MPTMSLRCGSENRHNVDAGEIAWYLDTMRLSLKKYIRAAPATDDLAGTFIRDSRETPLFSQARLKTWRDLKAFVNDLGYRGRGNGTRNELREAAFQIWLDYVAVRRGGRPTYKVRPHYIADVQDAEVERFYREGAKPKPDVRSKPSNGK